ncbi:hypothetical protein [Pseudarthrobacter sp. GA104]|uniref:hypothetical protein n=1 Tax=Pseudarthrobacter sp. GA104 TaxID=2676311 RepID=UPI0012F84636|nr:hypothetical protein [Pseudarthrobacter sp. GA104]MUU73467.1 hypothetical protein [Pseudarthrobacter sp. GA104]
MTLSLRASNLPIKYERPRETHRSGMTIYEVSGAGLYRVLEIHSGEFTVETLTPVGWMNLILLDKRDKISTAVEAMQIWLTIQTPTSAPETQQEEEAPNHG